MSGRRETKAKALEMPSHFAEKDWTGASSPSDWTRRDLDRRRNGGSVYSPFRLTYGSSSAQLELLWIPWPRVRRENGPVKSCTDDEAPCWSRPPMDVCLLSGRPGALFLDATEPHAPRPRQDVVVRRAAGSSSFRPSRASGDITENDVWRDKATADFSFQVFKSAVLRRGLILLCFTAILPGPQRFIFSGNLRFRSPDRTARPYGRTTYAPVAFLVFSQRLCGRRLCKGGPVW